MKFAIAVPLFSRRECCGGVIHILIVQVRSLQSLGKRVGGEQTRGGSTVPALSAHIQVSPEMLGENQRRVL